MAVGCLLFGLCFTTVEPFPRNSSVLLLVGLGLFTELVALPLGRVGFLSFSFVWLFTLAQTASVTVASLTCLFGLILRTVVSGKGDVGERLDGLLSDYLPCQSSLLLMGVLSGEQGDFGFPKGALSGFVGFLSYLLISHLVLTFLFTRSSDGSYLTQALQARRLQFRLNTVLAPAATALAVQTTWWSLWVFPVLLAVHHFSWDRLQELRALSEEGDKKQELLDVKERQLENKERKLNFTEDEKEVVEVCLREFSQAGHLEPTRQAILRLALKFSSAREAFLVEQSADGLAPSCRLDAQGQVLEIMELPVRGLVERAQRNATICRDKESRFWAFPLFEEGVLLLTGLSQALEEHEKRLLALLARQATFGLRSARLFEQLATALDGEKEARIATERARQELVKSQEHLIQSSKMAAVGQLAAGVAHELNSPLAAVLLAVQAGKRALKKEQVEKGLERFSDCEDAVRKAKHIVEGLLTQSKPTSKEFSSCSAKELCDQTCRFLSERLSRSGVDLQLRLADDATVQVIAGEISQILTNLILNATQAVQGKSSTGQVVVSLKRVEAEVVIRVADTGPGIADAHRDRIFEPFFTTRSEGTGLGLYICQQLAERNGASLRLVKTGAQGTTFALSLPLAG